MAKNMTRKGLAFGAGIALVSSGLATPAFAGVDNGSVSLAPAAGAEYDILSGSQFDLKSNFTSAVQGTGKYLKFLVEDAAGTTSVVTSAGSSVYSATSADGNDIVVVDGTGTIADTATVTFGAAHKFKVGDRIRISSGGVLTSEYNLDAVHTVTAVPSNTTLEFEYAAATGDGSDAADADFTISLEPSVPTPYSISSASGADAAISSNVLTITTAAHELLVGDTVTLSGFNSTIDGTHEVASTPSATTFTVALTASDLASTDLDGTIKRVDAAYTKYIFDTKRDSNAGADSVLRLASADIDATQTVSVTAWIDDNDNGLIDATEYQSPARTVRFLAHSAVTPTVSIDPIYVGQSTVTARVTTDPVLNGSQLVAANNRNGAANALRIGFTRPGSANALWADSMSYSNITKVWTATSENMNITTTGGNLVSDNSTAGWGIAQPVAQAADTPANSVKVAIKDNIVTFTTGAAHGLQVGDRVVIADSTANTRVNSSTTAGSAYSTVLSVPTTTTFTYKEVGTTATALAEVVDTLVTMAVTGGESKILRNFTVAGEYSATAYLYKGSTTGALTSTGVITKQVVGASVATGSSIEGVASDNVNADGNVRKGTTSADFVVAVTNKDGDPVPAGVKVAMTAAKTLGTASVIKVNGVTVGTTAVAISGVTDANGEVAIKIENSAGAAGDQVNLTADAEGATSSVSAVWANPVYSILDLSDATANSSARNRAADADGSYTHELLVVDQFKKAAPAGIRLLATVTGRTTLTTPVSLVDGKATVKVTPDGSATTGDTTVKLNFQTQNTLGVWSSVGAGISDASYVDWDGESGELAAVAIKFYNQTDAVNFNATGANFPSTTVADLTADVTTKTLKAIDLRTINGAAETYTAATKAVVSGNVTNSVTGVAKAGATLTISGTGMLFKVGDVWANEAVTFVSGDGSFAAEVYSRTAGKQKVKVTSGAVSKEVEVTFTAVGGVKGYSVVLSAPAVVQPGSTYKVEGQILDVNGNGVALTTAGTGANPTLSVTYQGLGFVNGALPTTTDVNGKFIFYVLLGTNDVGTAVITASYDADGTGTTFAAATQSATVAIGSSAALVSSWTKNLGGGEVKMYAKNIVGVGKVQFMLNGEEVAWVRAVDATDPKLRTANGASYLVRTVDLVEGQKNVLEIYVDGERTTRTAYTY